MRHFIIFIFLIIVIIILLQIIDKNNLLKKSENLNLVLISIDTLRPDHMGVYGYPKNTTPNIDKLSRNAFVFNNALTLTPQTLPSFVTLMTGKNPFLTNIFSNNSNDITSGRKISPYQKTLAQYLKHYNYKTASFITSGILSQSLTNINNGIDDYHYINYYYKEVNGKKYYETDRNEYEKFLNQTDEWIEKNKHSKFFLWVHLIDPHSPYDPPEDLKCKFNNNLCQEINSKTMVELEDKRNSLSGCGNVINPHDIELYESLYDGDIASSDRLTANILASLKANGLDNKTMVLIYGDHGEGFDHNYNFDHGDTLYQSAV